MGGGEGWKAANTFRLLTRTIRLLSDIFEKGVAKIYKSSAKKICGNPLANFWEDIDISLPRTHSSAVSLAGRQLYPQRTSMYWIHLRAFAKSIGNPLETFAEPSEKSEEN